MVLLLAECWGAITAPKPSTRAATVPPYGHPAHCGGAHSMKALYKTGPHPGLELVDRPEPEPGPGEVKIRVMTTGICGTDLHLLDWDPAGAGMAHTPLVPGHEFYGEVVAVGELVHDVQIGDRVSGEGHIVCGIC